MKLLSAVGFMVCLCTTTFAQQVKKPYRGDATFTSGKTIRISPENFKKGYPAVIFNLKSGAVIPIEKGASEEESFKGIKDRSFCFFIEPRDPEFSSLAKEGAESIILVDNADYQDFVKPALLSGLTSAIAKKNFKKGNVFYIRLGTSDYVMQLLNVDKERQVLQFRYKQLP